MATPNNNYMDDLREDYFNGLIMRKSDNLWYGEQTYRNTKYQSLSAWIILAMFVCFVVMVGLILREAYNAGMFDSVASFSLLDWLNSLPTLVNPSY